MMIQPFLSKSISLRSIYTNPSSRVAHLKPVRNDVRSCVAELLGGDGGLLKQESIRSECYVFGSPWEIEKYEGS